MATEEYDSDLPKQDKLISRRELITPGETSRDYSGHALAVSIKSNTSTSNAPAQLPTVTVTYGRPDLARILVEGTKVVYGAQRAEQVQKELGGQQGAYRTGTDLTAIVERVCSEPEVRGTEAVEAVPAKSIDDVVRYESQKPSMLRVAVKGTVNLANRTCWYYPLVGVLPRNYQQQIAERLGDSQIAYSVANMVAELVCSTAFTYAVTHDRMKTVIVAMISVIHSLARTTSIEKKKYALGNALIALPMYAALYITLAAEAVPQVISSAGKAIKDAVKYSYTSAWKQEKQRLLPPGRAVLQELNHVPETPVASVLSTTEEGQLGQKSELQRVDTTILTQVVPARVEQKSETADYEVDVEIESDDNPTVANIE